ncbi:hypothetical protein [[Mycoplasma] anseris]|uniref:Uncharacterized protein n=1 Tax=[Mycoplasma] anseris TaxID=92400 RepID=A0A2Z4NEB6_9BACT|nr:hypothetical protein [[Mycoplasma] anseris]AWX69695.1 hypothetical protein DP065_02990 [[Mycoplasma] anseris]
MIKTEELIRYGITLDDFLEFGIISAENFKVPNKILKLNPDYENDREKLFNHLAISIFHTINNLLGQLPEKYKSADYEAFINEVGKTNAENLKGALYSELRYRIFNNVWPEFADKTYLSFGGYANIGDIKKFNEVTKLLSPEAILYLNNSNWYELNSPDIIAEILKNHPSYEEFERFKNSLIIEVEKAKNDEINLELQKHTTLINDNFNNLANQINEANNKTDLYQTKNDATFISIKQSVRDLERQTDNLQTTTIQLIHDNLEPTNTKLNLLNDSVVDSQSKIILLNQNIEEAKAKTHALEAALTANTTADAETLKKFNDLNAKYHATASDNNSKINYLTSRLNLLEANKPKPINDYVLNEINKVFRQIDSEDLSQTETIFSISPYNYALTIRADFENSTVIKDGYAEFIFQEGSDEEKTTILGSDLVITSGKDVFNVKDELKKLKNLINKVATLESKITKLQTNVNDLSSLVNSSRTPDRPPRTPDRPPGLH